MTCEERYRQFLLWRGVACLQCNGYGKRIYSNTTTWMGGYGDQMLIRDVCDACWGTGDTEHKGVNLKALCNKSRMDK